ncbi:MAG: hypothetical protein JXJ17_02845 [Anaerolineae bacterium]|nr:hypothetical protein [Anaerolineae bacterium]
MRRLLLFEFFLLLEEFVRREEDDGFFELADWLFCDEDREADELERVEPAFDGGRLAF